MTLTGVTLPPSFEIGQSVRVRGRPVERLGIDYRMPGGRAIVVRALSDAKGEYYAVEFLRTGRQRYVRPEELKSVQG